MEKSAEQGFNLNLPYPVAFLLVSKGFSGVLGSWCFEVFLTKATPTFVTFEP
jgi:hypothetical protein